MDKPQFGRLLQAARRRKGLSLRVLAERTGLNYSRLSRIEHGTRPAPGLAEIRRLAESLEIDMSELLVSTGTPREVMEHLLWSERLHSHEERGPGGTELPEWARLYEKNSFRLPVVRRNGGLCTVRLGREDLVVLDFGRARMLRVAIPPEAILIFRADTAPAACSAGNVLMMTIKKIRRLGQVTNLVLSGEGFELNSLHAEGMVRRLDLAEGDAVAAAVQATAIHA